MTAQASAKSNRSWGLILFQSIALLVLGVALISAPLMSILVLVSFLGFYWLISGVLSIARVFTRAGRAHWLWSLLVGIVGIAAGLIVLRHPLYSAALAPAVLVVILGIGALIMGVANLIRGFSGDGFWAVVLGLVDFIFGAVLLGSPFFAAVFVPITLGILSLIGGIALIPTAFTVRRGEKEALEEVVEERKMAA